MGLSGQEAPLSTQAGATRTGPAQAEPVPATPSRSDTPNRLWLLLPLGGALALFFLLDGPRHLSLPSLARHQAELRAWVEAHPALAPLAAAGLYAAMVALSLPICTALTVLAGFLFGPVVGTIVVMAGATTGAILLFVAARTTLGDLFRPKVERALQRMDAGFRDNAFNYLLFLRLAPIFPFWLVNIAPAFTSIPLRSYAAATVLGIFPGTLVYVLVGHGLGTVIDAGEEPEFGLLISPEILAPLIGLAILALVPVAIRRWRRAGASAPGGAGSRGGAREP